MASRSPPYCVLKVDKVKCCDCCKQSVQRALMKIRGVNLVTCDGEEGLVFVNGNVDPRKLMEVVESLGGKAKLVECKNDAEDDDHNDDDNRVRGSSTRQCCNDPRHKERKTRGGGGGGGGDRDEKNKVDNLTRRMLDHKPEPYVKPGVDPSICDDAYCDVHLRRPKIVRGLQQDDSLNYHPVAAMPMMPMMLGPMQFGGRYGMGIGSGGGGGGYDRGMMWPPLPPQPAQYVGGYSSVDERYHGLDPKYFYGQDHPL